MKVRIPERSLGALVLALLAAALASTSLAMPWWEYGNSTGRQTPHGGFHDPQNDGVERTAWTATPMGGHGEATSEDPEATERALQVLRSALVAAAVLGVLAALANVPGLDRVLRRPVALTATALAFTGLVLALAWGWFVLPESFGNGVTGPYSSFIDAQGDYTMTRLHGGWAVAGFAAFSAFGAFLFKFQAGARDPGIVADLYGGPA